MHAHQVAPINTNARFESEYLSFASRLLKAEPVERGSAHASSDATTAQVLELMHVTQFFQVDKFPAAWAEVVRPNLPWAEDHFQERVGGKPLNPPPSEQWWPFARQGNAEHKKDETFSHTYPERFWPTHAGKGQTPRMGIRFKYGDLSDLIEVLKKNPRSRQAYLPVWFPEDLTAAKLGERVPCSMGYHFLYNSETEQLDCVYTLRSCDLIRFYRDDMYMAGRLLQLVSQQIGMSQPGQLVVHINNLHCFPGDRPFLNKLVPNVHVSLDPRQNYNFNAL